MLRGRTEAGNEQVEPFGRGVDGSLELRILGSLQHGLELRAGRVSGGDQVAPGDERLRAKLLGGRCLVLLLGEVVEREPVVAGGAVEPVQGKMLVEARQPGTA